ncbi:MAG: hypothetical protein JSS50_04410 [Proteobacteria bacterium]|nr:hypothetical protein [Pseudomonadota bacterium]
MNLALSLDIVMICLLGLTIWFCWRLNGKIAALRESKHDLSEMVKTFDSAIAKTHKNVAELKAMSTSSSQELQLYINKAGELIGDLSYMTEAASKLADRLESGISKARHSNNPSIGVASSSVENIRPTPQPVRNEATIEPLSPRATMPLAANDAVSNSHTPFTKSSQELLNAIRDLEDREG